ncbi:MAG: hypothetical protein AB8E82_12945 [Aureispira sp.]
MKPLPANAQKVLIAVLAIFALWDLYTSFDFYRHSELMGDFTTITLPHAWYTPVLEDPLGLNVMMTGEGHAATNRFWAHYITYAYFNQFPFLLQNLGISPIDSIYLACGWLKLLTQLGIILLFSKWILGNTALFSKYTIALVAFLCPFFLTADTHYRAFDLTSSMKIIDPSIAYTIFYASSLLLLLLYLHPFLQRAWGLKTGGFSIPQHLLLFLLSFVISFNGPTSSPVILLICPLILLSLWYKNFKELSTTPFAEPVVAAIKMIPKELLFHFVWVGVLNLYSFYLGTFNLENPTTQPLLLERYGLLWQGFYHHYIYNNYHIAPWAVLFIWTLINTKIIVGLAQPIKQKRYINTFKVLLLFSIGYILLLPLGGYRAYRPFIIRYDVAMPVNLGLLFLFAYSCTILVKQLQGTPQKIYTSLLIGLVVFLSIVDRTPNSASNVCEYEALQQLAKAEETLVELPPCKILSWSLYTDPTGADSETVCKTLYLWNIIDTEEKRYYVVEPE